MNLGKIELKYRCVLSLQLQEKIESDSFRMLKKIGAKF
jgi:hypothetical protein